MNEILIGGIGPDNLDIFARERFSEELAVHRESCSEKGDALQLSSLCRGAVASTMLISGMAARGAIRSKAMCGVLAAMRPKSAPARASFSISGKRLLAKRGRSFAVTGPRT